MSSQPADIEIFGRTLRINCPNEQRTALDLAAKDLNLRLQDLQRRTKVKSTEQLILTVALNLCYELAQEKQKNLRYIQDKEIKIKELVERVSDMLIEQE